ncbi:nanos homolog 2-like [Protopterus annectens]|uniref:nanos homolog 2-like n=1 Tax=Protopterus annectens TaxID=7888 RepID=UPI001CFA7587|nr:nanos homolog 2-like [Protopterus annectens]
MSQQHVFWPKDFNMWKDYFQLSKLVKEMMEHRTLQEYKLSAELHSQSFKDATQLNSQSASGGTPIGNRSSTSGSSTNGLKQDASGSQNNGGCNFCKHNGESKVFYSSHVLKKQDGSIICPILRKYVCPVCSATGDFAHTLSYCPFNEEKNRLYRRCGRNSAGRKYKR